MARADAGHLAACVWVDCYRLKGSQNRVVDIWASDCLNVESPGLRPFGINPLILTYQTRWSSLHAERQFRQDWTYWPNLGFNELHWAKPVQERRATGVQQWCVQLVGLRQTQTWPSSNSGMKKHMKDRRLSLASQQLLLLLSYYRIRWLIFPAYASLVSNGTSKSSSLRKIHKDHTAYSSGEVYPSTFKMRVHI